MNSYPFSVCCVHELKNSKIQLLNRAKSSHCFFYMENRYRTRCKNNTIAHVLVTKTRQPITTFNKTIKRRHKMISVIKHTVRITPRSPVTISETHSATQLQKNN